MFVAIGTQLEMSMRHIVMWSLGIYYAFSHYMIKDNIFEKKKILNIKCMFRFSSETFLILRRNE